MARRLRCHSCAEEIELEDPIGRSARCARCGSELRCCLNCRFYDAGSYNDCSEPSAERVLEKDRANFCDYFSPASAAAVAGGAAPGGDKLSDLEKLFRK